MSSNRTGVTQTTKREPSKEANELARKMRGVLDYEDSDVTLIDSALTAEWNRAIEAAAEKVEMASFKNWTAADCKYPILALKKGMKP